MSPSRVRFGPFEVDRVSGELRRDGVVVPLQELPFRLLLILIDRPNDLVTRDELRDRLWTDTVIDFDAGLNTAVRKLRDALGDTADNARFVQTIPRRGYRLNADVRQVSKVSLPDVARVEADGAPSRTPWRWLVASGALAVLASFVWFALPPAREPNRLLVLPFEASTAGDIVAEAISDEIIGHIGRLAPDTLEVLGPATSRKYRTARASLPNIGRDVMATHVLTGRVTRGGERLRVAVSLARVADGVQIWSDIFEPGPASLPDATASVVTSVATGLARPFGLRDSRVQARAATLKTAAFEAYLRGRTAWEDFDEKSFRRSRKFFEEAIRLDPNYADAHAGAADASNMLALSGVQDKPEQLAFAVAAARRATALAPENAAGHAALAVGLFYSMDDWPSARVEFERALALDSGRAVYSQWAAGYYSATGDHRRALALAERARTLDPASSWVNIDLCWYYLYAREYRQAVEQADRTSDATRSPAVAFCRELAFRGQHDDGGESDAYIERLRLFGGSPALVAQAQSAKASAGIAGLREFQLARLLSAGTFVNPYVGATSAAALGRSDLALRILTDASVSRPAFWPFLRVDPSFDVLRSDPAFGALLDSTGPPRLKARSSS